jgi:hypothetical protein
VPDTAKYSNISVLQDKQLAVLQNLFMPQEHREATVNRVNATIAILLGVFTGERLQRRMQKVTSVPTPKVICFCIETEYSTLLISIL